MIKIKLDSKNLIDFNNYDKYIFPEKLWTKRDNENLYLLDATNSRIVKLDKDGKIIAEYYHSEITNALDFAVSESKNQIVFTTQNSAQAFNLN